MGKHRERRERREKYRRMLDAELSDDRAEKVFTRRVIGTMDHRGMDLAPDGRRIRADFWRYITSRLEASRQTAVAGQFLVQKAVRSLQLRHPNGPIGAKVVRV